MLLRESGESEGVEADLRGISEGGAAAASVPSGEALVEFAEAVVVADPEPLARARERVAAELGPTGLVEAAGVAANFQRMVRIADSTGIPLEASMEALAGDVPDALGYRRFGSAANTRPSGAVRRALGRLFRPMARAFIRWMARRRSAR